MLLRPIWTVQATIFWDAFNKSKVIEHKELKNISSFLSTLSARNKLMGGVTSFSNEKGKQKVIS